MMNSSAIGPLLKQQSNVSEASVLASSLPATATSNGAAVLGEEPLLSNDIEEKTEEPRYIFTN
jgi:hypothetical protein